MDQRDKNAKNENNILYKGSYREPQVAELTSVKQYIVTKSEGKKELLLRLSNDRGEVLTGALLRIRQYNVKGEFIRADKYTLKGLDIAPYTLFGVEDAFSLDNACVDFKIDVLTASYGSYTYEIHGEETNAIYREEIEEKPFDTKKVTSAMGGRKHVASVRSLKAPVLFIVVSCIILAALFAVSIAHLRFFVLTETCFTLDNIEYRFVDNDKDNGAIVITGYTGNSYNLIIPAEIEGHKISGIDKAAFKDSDIRSIVIEGNTTIHDSAFEGADNLQEVTISNVTSIGNKAFKNCGELKSVVLGSKLEAIGDSCFENCGKLQSIALSEKLKSIGNSAFKGCGLSKLEVPSSVEKIGEAILEECGDISDITLPFIGESLSKPNVIGYVFGVDSGEYIPESLKRVKITLSDMIIADTFNGCAYIESIDYVKSVKIIGNRAFYGCSLIKSFELDGELTDIGSYAFANCFSLDSIYVPASIETIKEATFENCYFALTLTIEDGIKRIEKNAFGGCNSIVTIIVPDSVSYIAENAFVNCIGIESLTVPFVGQSAEEPSSLVTILGEGSNHSIKSVTVTGSTSICDSAFEGITSIVHVYLSGEVREIGSRAFAGCENLAGIVLPEKMTKLGNSAFFGCTSLLKVKLSEGITSIEERTFEGCTALNEIKIPDSVISVGPYAFSGCVALGEVLWSENVQSMGEYTFNGCTSLKHITIPAAMTSIPDGAFENCEGLLSVAIPAEVISIGTRSFAGCASLSGVELPAKLETLKNEAFADCAIIRDFKLPHTVTTLGTGVLSGCSAVEKLTVPILNENSELSASDGYLGYFFDPENSGENSYVPETLSTVVLTGSAKLADGAFKNCAKLRTVQLWELTESIGVGTFSGCASIIAITIPKDVSVIGSEAFLDCTGLVAVDLPQALVEINDSVFSGCTSLFEIKLPGGVKSINNSAFASCSSLTEMKFPEEIEAIGDGAFSGCSGLIALTLPDGIISIGNGAFSECSSLKELSLPFVGGIAGDNQTLAYIFGGTVPEALEKVTLTSLFTLSDNAFLGCANIKSINLPDGIINIGNGAFCGCSSITELSIPDSVLVIGSEAFNGCVGLTEFFIPASVEFVGANAFGGCSSIKEITVPFVGSSREDGYGIAYLFGASDPESLKKVVVTDISKIYENEFSFCTGLEEVIIESEVIEIEASAFKGCTSLKSITLPDTVQTIKDAAFEDCRSLRSFTLPKQLSSIGENAFLNCYRLFEVYNTNTEVISVAEGEIGDGYVGYYAINVYYDDEAADKLQVKGASYLKDIDSGEWYLTDLNDTEGEVVLPGAVSSQGIKINEYHVPAYLFCQKHDITSVTVPKAVKSIGICAFFNCSALKDLVMNENCQITEISAYAFSECVALENVVLSDSVKTISQYAFANCTALESIDISEKLEIIERFAFSNCQSLSSVFLPDTMLSIEDYAFVDCYKLYEVYDNTGLGIEIGSDANGCVALNALIVHTDPNAEPLHDVNVDGLAFKKSDNSWFLVGYEGSETKLDLSSFIYNGRRVASFKVASNALNGNATVKELIIGDAVSTIGQGAFNNCANLESVDMSKSVRLTDFYDAWFDGCGSLKSFVFPCNIDRVSRTVFYAKSSLESVSFAGNTEITSLPKGIFSECANLKAITLPDGLLSLEDCFFENYGNLESISFGNNTAIDSIPYAAFRNCSALVEIELPDSVTVIGDSAFYNCTALKSVKMGSRVVRIDPMAFAYCSALDSVTLPVNLNYIGDSAFYSCTSLGSIKIPSGVNEINYQTFAGCSDLKSVELPTYLSSIGAEAFASSGLTSITLPSRVEVIGNSAFNDCDSLVSADLSKANNATNLGGYAFYNCDSLETVKLPSNMYYIGEYSFGSCQKLANVTLPANLDTIAEFAFNNCTGLKSIALPNSLVEIGAGAFMECDSLRKIDTPYSLERINSDAFSGCDALEAVSLSSNVYEIGSRAFSNCVSLASIKLPSSVRTLGSYAFSGCTSLKSADLSSATDLTTLSNYVFNACSALSTVQLPDRITSIKMGAFENCSSLGSITIPYSVSSIGSNAFLGCNTLCEVWNLSPFMYLEKGSEGYGYVAYYAIAIHDSLSDAALTYDKITVDGVTYYFAYARSENERYLYSIEGNNSVNSGMLLLPEYSKGKYIVTRNAVDANYNKVIVYDSVVGFEYSAWDRIAYSTVYYHGNYRNWSNMLNNYGLYFGGYYYEFVNCKHEQGNTWSYDKQGKVTLAVSTKTETVTKSPTCYAQGELRISCDGCGEAEYFVLDIVGHNCNAENICSMCGQVVINDASVASKYLDFDFDYSFKYDDGYGFYSDNFGIHDTVAVMTFTADKDMTVMFDYYVSSESGGDYLYVVQGDYNKAVITGETAPKTMTLKLTEGEVLTFMYEKNSSENDGEDRGYICNILIKYAN